MEGPKRESQLWYVLSFAFQLGFIIVVPIAGFLLVGRWADDALQTSPLFIVLGIFVGIGITIYEVYHMLLPVLEAGS